MGGKTRALLVILERGNIVQTTMKWCSWCLLLSIDNNLKFIFYTVLEQIIKLTVTIDQGEDRSARKSWCGFVRNS